MTDIRHEHELARLRALAQEQDRALWCAMLRSSNVIGQMELAVENLDTLPRRCDAAKEPEMEA